MIYLRNLILTVAILGLIFVGHHWPRAVKDNQTPYCVVTFKAARPLPDGSGYETGWAQGYGPCDQQDIYREI